VSLDGVTEDLGRSGAFEHRGWTIPYWKDELAKYQSEHLFASDALLQRRAPSDDSQRNLIDAFRIMLYPLVLESERIGACVAPQRTDLRGLAITLGVRA
jgi:hypothetical protein